MATTQYIEVVSLLDGRRLEVGPNPGRLSGLPPVSTGPSITSDDCSTWLQNRLGARRPISCSATPVSRLAASDVSSTRSVTTPRRSRRRETNQRTGFLHTDIDVTMRETARLMVLRPTSRDSVYRQQQRGTGRRRSSLVTSLSSSRPIGGPVNQWPTTTASINVNGRSGNGVLERAIAVLRDRQLTVRLMASSSRTCTADSPTMTSPERNDMRSRFNEVTTTQSAGKDGKMNQLEKTKNDIDTRTR